MQQIIKAIQNLYGFYFLFILYTYFYFYKYTAYIPYSTILIGVPSGLTTVMLSSPPNLKYTLFPGV